MKSNYIAVECEFRTIDDFWNFFQFPEIDFSPYVFLNVEHNVYSDRTQIHVAPIFTFSYLKKMIQKKFIPEYMVLHLYPKNLPLGRAAEQMETIEEYQDYIRSDCQMIILAYDCTCVEVYCKNPVWLQSIIDYATHISGTEVTPKSILTDARTTMYL